MVHLTLTGLSEDGRQLLFVSDEGVEFTADLDARLRAALQARQGGDQARQGQLEMQMDSTLRPRDIQARIRAGETPETVAQVAGTSVDKVMPYAAPVLAERAHVAQRAQRASIRRPPGDGPAAGSGRTLGEAVGSHLRGRNVDPDSITWDAWRREDGRWTLTGAYAAGGRVGAAHFSFDAPGNYVVADDDDAHWLLGEVPDAPAEAAPAAASRDDLSTARQRRLSAVPPDELPLGEDAIELVSEPAAGLGAEQPVEAYLDEPLAPGLDDDTATSDPVAAADDPAHEADVESDEESGEESGDDDHARHEPPSRKPVKKTRGRASVPSWDEIMFGGGAEE
ncbi:septation protein SepH [Nocardioides cynanchi]|uniref:septation protein SepH n=1 Tax=Nocardioides cynanchi TaxID=2558918 RepID=UPI00124631BB|nr:septation protein SepH [Nocardioides cynanchi]